MVYNNQQSQQQPPQQQNDQGSTTPRGPSNFYDYAQRREARRTKSNQRSWMNQPGIVDQRNNLGQQQYQPGQVSRPDGRPSPGGNQQMQPQQQQGGLDNSPQAQYAKYAEGNQVKYPGEPMQDFNSWNAGFQRSQQGQDAMYRGGGQAMNTDQTGGFQRSGNMQQDQMMRQQWMQSMQGMQQGQQQAHQQPSGEQYYPGGGSVSDGRMWDSRLGQMVPDGNQQRQMAFPGYTPQQAYNPGNYGVNYQQLPQNPQTPPTGQTPPAGQNPAQPAAPTPPTPSAPKPGPDWQPTQDGQGWVPPGHPNAWKAPAGNTAPGTTPGTPGSSSSVAGMEYFNKLSPYQKSQVNVNLPQMYNGYTGTNFGNDPFTSYGFDSNRISQFSGPNQGQTQGGVNSLMQNLLANPTSMTDSGVGALKDKQKETALAVQKAAMGSNAEEMARSGRFGGGGYQAQGYAWDYLPGSGQWACRNKANGQFANLENCNGLPKVDNWR
jgi:hypothetical protein